MERRYANMDLPIWVIFVAALLVVGATSLFKQIEWPQKTKAVVATVISVIAAGVATLVTGDFTGENLWEASLAMFGVSQAFYQLIFRGTKPEEKLALAGNKTAAKR